MKNDCFFTMEEKDSLYLHRVPDLEVVRIKFGEVVIEVTNKQLLDLGMKIQAVVNQIDKENKQKGEQQ